MALELLSAPIRKFIRDKGWSGLRPIQQLAISRILTSGDNFILASATASGKTEAAFLPILSKLDFSNPGLQVVYVSPLIALINDQFSRVEELCQYLDIVITKWHGEASQSLKAKLLKAPSGILLITPESLEAMFVTRPFHLKRLFSNLEYLVIDEIHSFLGTDRGVHLKSLLSRLQELNNKSFSIVGLSATIGDYDEAKEFTGNKVKTKVLLDKTPRKAKVNFRFFENKGIRLPQDLMMDLYTNTKDKKVLLFPNSRGRVEEIAVTLKKISQRLHGHQNYFSHHSSVAKEEREFIENFAKNNQRANLCISCTSTLELGIDIGSINEIVQIDSTQRVDSLIQRVGRSARNEGGIGSLRLYATSRWSLLQSIASWLLYLEGFIEPSGRNEKAYDILVHQALSITRESSGIGATELVKRLGQNFAFPGISRSEIVEILQHLISIDLLQISQQELLIGIEGEKIVNSREFYSMFKAEKNFNVEYAGRSIGEIPSSPQLLKDENILLSAKVWKIVFIDRRAKKVEVIPAADGKKPVFFGEASYISPEIRERMFAILYAREAYDFLDEAGCKELNRMRREFSFFKINSLLTDRPLLYKKDNLQFFTFTGTRINQTLQLLFNLAGISNTLDESSSSFHITLSEESFPDAWKNLPSQLSSIDDHLIRMLESRPGLLGFSKWGIYLPVKYQAKLLKNKLFDTEATHQYLTRHQAVSYNATSSF